MEMDEEMEDSMELTFTAVEIDLDYEFDAARCFDFTREESSAEAREAELWFESAGTYPPSPFVTKLLLREDILQKTVNISPKSKDVVNATLPYSDVGLGQDFSVVGLKDRGMNGGILTTLQSDSVHKFQNQPQQLPTELIFYNHMTKDNSRAETKSVVKPSFPRTSTLMKPTASQLAKQNQPRQVGGSRVLKFLVENNERSSNNPLGIECQAAKRQKLEGGHLRKVAETKHQSNLVHKAPKRDGPTDGNLAHAKLRLTIPRQPDLETAHRAQKMRPKSTTEPERATSTIRKFKALPLNRKILEAPSSLLPKRSTPRLPEFQEFHLKTLERAMQHTSAVSSSSVSCSDTDKVLHKPSTNAIAENANGESRRPNFANAPKQEGCEFIHNFKARPLNKKIFSSKGDIGVFRNSKKETTVPMEFNFHTEKRGQHNPPVDLFNKLSLTELQPSAGSHLKLPRPSCVPSKGSKENRLGSFQQEHEINHLVKEKPPRFGGTQIQCGSDGGITEVGPVSGMSRSLGIR
ncbi:Protein TPX2 [Camellia lanceoleosa]|uniref:Protein TPX2 n=1 Tax=Camellia lanceoleosa TaxID=1840588 RepID=A0ACC0G1T7_9ERIC|nr:Protein TPX2 [Camellia lanceoleosa]